MITVIGGSGFVGSKLIAEIGETKCINIDKNPSPFFSNITQISDIRQSEKINISPKSNFVVLLAAEHRDDVSPVSLYYDVNVSGTKNVLNEMDRLGIKKLIFTSSVAVYGLNKNNPDETHEVDPFNHYGKSKFEAELIIKEWYEKAPNEKSVTIIRPTVIFGERNRGNVYNLLKQISSAKFIMVGNGHNKKSMAYVGNVTAFIKNRLNKSQPGFQIFNYSDKPDFNMNELVSLIQHKLSLKISKFKVPFLIGLIGGLCFDIASRITSKKFSISSVRVKKFCATTQFNSDKVHKIFDAPYTLEKGLNLTLNYEFIEVDKDEIIFYSE